MRKKTAKPKATKRVASPLVQDSIPDNSNSITADSSVAEEQVPVQSKFQILRNNNVNFKGLRDLETSYESLLKNAEYLLLQASYSGSEKSVEFFENEVDKIQSALINLSEFERVLLTDTLNLSGGFMNLAEKEVLVINTKIFEMEDRETFIKTFY